jgi:PAS domain S-box-containing protein
MRLRPQHTAEAMSAILGLDTADPMRWWMSSIWVAVLLGSLYMLAAKLSLSLLTPDGVAVFWPAAGIAAGFLIVLGPSARLAVVVGTMAATILANLLGDRNLWSAFVFALCNAGEAVLTAALVEHSFGSGFSLNRLRNVLGLMASAIVAAALSGVGGTLGFVYFHGGATSPFVTWQNWFASDALGIIAVAPLIIGLATSAREPSAKSEPLEGSLALAALVVIGIIVILLPPEPWKTVVPIALLFPLLLWIAARCRPVFAAAAAFIITIAIVWTTTVGVGYFGDPGLAMADRVLTAQASILAIALCAYVLAALFAERRRSEAALMESEARLQEALTAGAVTAFVWDVGTESSQRSSNAAQILGFDPQQTFTVADFLSRVHADDRERLKALVRSISRENPAYNISFRFKRPDGRDIWLEETAKGEFDPQGRPLRLQGLTLDVTERKRAEEQQSQLIAELDHRVKNLLARVSVVATHTRQGSSSLDDYVRALDRRIQSMANAHSLLSRNRWLSVDVAELVRDQLSPYGSDANTTVDGPSVALPPAVTQTLAMVLHELATNAAKYGALSTPHGRVEISWRHGHDEHTTNLTIAWREIRGPAVPASPASGYGVSLIRDLIPRELGGSADIVFAPEGVRCEFGIPFGTERREDRRTGPVN